MRALVQILLYSAAWAGFGVASGWVAHRRPVAAFEHDTWLTRLRPWEARGRRYDRWFRVRRWKDRLPEAGALFAGGWAKDRIRSFAPADLRRLAAETRRAEWVHWANIAFGASFALWTPWDVAVVMVVFGLVVHLPFVGVQRYNRARLVHVLATSRRCARLPPMHPEPTDGTKRSVCPPSPPSSAPR